MVYAAGREQYRSATRKLDQQTQLPHVDVAAEDRIEVPTAGDAAKAVAEVQPVEMLDGESVGPTVERCGGEDRVDKVVSKCQLAFEDAQSVSHRKRYSFSA
jgi:hypothetical protein